MATSLNYSTNCRYFSGYKPCGKSLACNVECSSYSPVNTRILIVHLGAMGAVVRSTSLLKSIRRKYPHGHITWITESPMQSILEGNPLIDRILVNDVHGHVILKALKFDVAMIIDKSLESSGLLAMTTAKEVFGFMAGPASGAILPATAAAEELWQLGLDDNKKFFVNKKTESQLVTEALELPYLNDDYFVPVSIEEKLEIIKRKENWLKSVNAAANTLVVGINTGCGPLMPAKKLSVSFQRALIKEMLAHYPVQIILLGGREDTLRNQAIGAGLPVIQSSTDKGIKDGLISIAACDVVITGDSLGMHLAIAMEKFVVAWFGPSCAHEIELYGRGKKILTKAPCSPCWKRSCQKPSMCYDQVDAAEILAAVSEGLLECSRPLEIPQIQSPILPTPSI